MIIPRMNQTRTLDCGSSITGSNTESMSSLKRSAQEELVIRWRYLMYCRLKTSY